MQEHHIQRDILYKLVLSDHARFADLRPKSLDSNVFTYHLKQLIKEKLVVKDDDGLYSLTPLGRVAGINITLSKKELLEQAHSVLLMCLKTKEEGWLLRKRLAQPMYHKLGFVHSEPKAHEDALKTAANDFKERTGLTCSFKPAGFGYVRLYSGEDLESFVHFILLCADNYEGELEPISRNGENIWIKDPNFKAENMIPSMYDMVQLMDSSKSPFYADLNYQLNKASITPE
jgi:hypothetical protein